MKPLQLFLTSLIFYFLLLAKSNATTCAASHDSLAAPTCSASSNLAVTNADKQVCIHQSISMTSQCSQSTYGTYLRVQAEYTAGSPADILILRWSSTNPLPSYYQWVTVDSSGTETLYPMISGSAVATLTYFACLDITTGYAYFGHRTVNDFSSGKAQVPDYTTISSLSSVVFYFCDDGTNSAACTLHSTIISYELPPDQYPYYYLWSVSATLIRSYAANEGSGNSLTDSTNGQDASFGSNAPTWSTTSYGVEFTSDDQYITIPTFTIQPGDELTAYAFTVTMWIKLTSLPSTDSYIFRRSSSDLSTYIFALKVKTDGTLSATIVSKTFDSSTLTPNQWTKISTSLNVQTNYMSYFVSIQIDDQSYNSGSSYSEVLSGITFSSSDQVRIGGPTGVLGKIYKLEIYSPGSSVYLPFSCGSDTSTTTFAIENIPYLYDCDNACSTCFGPDSTDCLSCSLSSYGIYESECVSCPSSLLKGDLCYMTSSSESSDSSFVMNSINGLNGGRPTSDITTQVATVVGKGDPVGVQAQVSGKLFYCIQYFNITYSTDVYTILYKTQPVPGEDDPAYVPDISSSIKADLTTGRQVPYMFEKYSVPTSFILNFWKRMIFLFAIFAAVIITLAAAFSIEKWEVRYVPALAFTVLRELAQNYLLSELYSFWGDVILYATLQYRSIEFRAKSEWADFFISIIFLIAVFTVPIWHFLFLKKYRQAKNTSDTKKDKEVLTYFQDSNKGVKVFFKDFNDKYMLQQLFLIFLTTRDFIFNLMLTTMFEHPLAQIIILFILNIAMIIYITIGKPFKELFNFIQQMFYEGLLFVAHIILFALISLDHQNSKNTHARDVLGKVLIVESLIYTYGTTVITCISIGMSALKAYKDWKRKKAEEEAKAKAQVKLNYLETEGTPCRLVSEEGEINSPTAAKHHKMATDLNSATEEVFISLPTSVSSSPTNRLISAQGDLEAKKESRFKNLRIRGVDGNEDSEIIDDVMADFAQENDPSSPSKNVPESPKKGSKFTKDQ